MRLNRFIALATGMSRRAADRAIAAGQVRLNDHEASPGELVDANDNVTLDGKPIRHAVSLVTIALHKPVGIVCSRNGQGSKTIYDILPAKYHHLKTIGRLDKDSSGLILLTNDGSLAHELTHPSFQKEKQYIVMLDKKLSTHHQASITNSGVPLADGPSRLILEPMLPGFTQWKVRMHEGRNRQIRRTFEALGYNVIGLHRTHLGTFELGKLRPGEWREVSSH